MLIDESGKSCGVVSFDQAMLLAYSRELDLILVNGNINPPIAKLIDYSKELYRQEKLKRKQKAKSKTLELKEIKVGINIGQHDLETKARKTKEFLEKGHKVRVVVALRGREMIFQNRVPEFINNFTNLTNAEYEVPVKKVDRQFSAILRIKK